MTTALGVSADLDGNGVTPLVHRMIIGSYFRNDGVVDGLAVTGRSDLKYAVAAGLAVTQRAGSDGRMLAYWAGGTTETAVAAGDPSNPRIDVVWIRANNKPEYGSDPDNQVHVGVTQGTPAASPVRPTVPQGCTPLAWRLMPAGATSTQSATSQGSVDYAMPYGARLGKLAENWDRRDTTWGANVNVHVREHQVSFVLPTDRMLRFDFKCNFSPSKDNRSEWAASFVLDNQMLPHSAVNFVSTGTSWESHETSFYANVDAGRHTAMIDGWLVGYSKPHFRYTSDGNPLWIGRRFTVWDEGPVQ